jgi:hypothetical protein
LWSQIPRLRCREGEIEAAERPIGDVLHSEGLTAGRVGAGQHRGQLVGIDLALQAEIMGGVLRFRTEKGRRSAPSRQAQLPIS